VFSLGPFFHKYAVYMKAVPGWQNKSGVFENLHVISHTEYENVACRMRVNTVLTFSTELQVHKLANTIFTHLVYHTLHINRHINTLCDIWDANSGDNDG
jgi:hypothetical protein